MVSNLSLNLGNSLFNLKADFKYISHICVDKVTHMEKKIQQPCEMNA
jgi:hypothetical protein